MPGSDRQENPGAYGRGSGPEAGLWFRGVTILSDWHFLRIQGTEERGDPSGRGTATAGVLFDIAHEVRYLE